MNKKLIVILIATGLITTAVGYLVLGNSGDKMPLNQSAQGGNQSDGPGASTERANPSAATTPGRYIDYKEGIIAKTDSTKVLFFHAPWCPQCRDLETDIKQRGVPDGVTIIKVDYDTNQQLRQKYGVTLQTTVVLVDDEGNALKKFVAYDDPSMAAIERNLL